jgi:hypothetical protein
MCVRTPGVVNFAVVKKNGSGRIFPQPVPPDPHLVRNDERQTPRVSFLSVLLQFCFFLQFWVDKDERLILFCLVMSNPPPLPPMESPIQPPPLPWLPPLETPRVPQPLLWWYLNQVQLWKRCQAERLRSAPQVWGVGQHPSNPVVISDDEAEEKLEGEDPANPIVITDDDEEMVEGEHPSHPIVISDDEPEEEEEDPQPPVITPPPSPEYGGDIDSEEEYIEIAKSLQSIVDQASPDYLQWFIPHLQGMLDQADEIMEED